MRATAKTMDQCRDFMTQGAMARPSCIFVAHSPALACPPHHYRPATLLPPTPLPPATRARANVMPRAGAGGESSSSGSTGSRSSTSPVARSRPANQEVQLIKSGKESSTAAPPVRQSGRAAQAWVLGGKARIGLAYYAKGCAAHEAELRRKLLQCRIQDLDARLLRLRAFSLVHEQIIRSKEKGGVGPEGM